ncbi:MAG: hypothetical protein IEMM0002_0831 [bacterium]|nr:MAG: hypothetical protein IEMM0002_0831 [bacterium]
MSSGIRRRQASILCKLSQCIPVFIGLEREKIQADTGRRITKKTVLKKVRAAWIIELRPAEKLIK